MLPQNLDNLQNIWTAFALILLVSNLRVGPDAVRNEP
jgi:hypothetical protein